MSAKRWPIPTTALAVDHDDEGIALVARALMAGRLIATLRSKESNRHVTLQLQAKAKPASRWQNEVYNLATHVFIDVPNSGEFNDKVGTLYPPHSDNRWAGHFYPDRNADPARLWVAERLLFIAVGGAPMETDRYEVLLGTHCIRCGAELTEPQSIKDRAGPTCSQRMDAEYGNRHQHKAPRSRPVAPPIDDGADVHEDIAIAAAAPQLIELDTTLPLHQAFGAGKK